MTICVDFDGTIVEHEYPKIGPEISGAFMVLKELQCRGHELILWTMRSGKELQEAVEFCEERGIKFYGVNKNPGQVGWTSSPKAYAHHYIDDAAVGCPLIVPEDSNYRPYVNWTAVAELLGMTGFSPISGELV